MVESRIFSVMMNVGLGMLHCRVESMRLQFSTKAIALIKIMVVNQRSVRKIAYAILRPGS